MIDLFQCLSLIYPSGINSGFDWFLGESVCEFFAIYLLFKVSGGSKLNPLASRGVIKSNKSGMQM
jgi:hypothetical protein